VVFRTAKERYLAVADEIARLHEEKQPVLVGTTSIEKSELLSSILARKGVKHVVLNAKYHEREAEIVAQAGRFGMVTIATNMAGRGTDILLGGNAEFVTKQELLKRKAAHAVSVAEGSINPTAAPGMLRFYYQGQEFETNQADWDRTYAQYAAAADREREQVIQAGGLHIIGTERHESRRIDNQLRGRAGRQGDPGASRFYLSLEDDLMRIFAKEWVSTLLQKLGMEEGVPIESRMITNRIEAAQKAVEGQNFEARKHLLEYDDVMNKQREAVYGLRRQLLEGLDQKDLILEDYVANLLGTAMTEFAPEDVHPDQWNVAGLKTRLIEQFGLDAEAEGIDIGGLDRHELGEALFERIKQQYEVKESILGGPAMRFHERMVMLSVLDGLWKDHLLNMDHLKEGIGLRGYGQQDPLVAYKKESFDMFEGMMARFQEDTARYLLLMQIMGPDGVPMIAPPSGAGGDSPQAGPPPVAPTLAPRAPAAVDGNGSSSVTATAVAQAIPVPVKAPSTTIDQLEQEFERKKKRELEHARMAGSNGDSEAPARRRTGEKVGRNDLCPCGSGKKYKKCHGAE
jgi:preprotein translocase subunit SecA